MVGRRALGFLSVAAVALTLAVPASAQTRAPDSDLAGLVFPSQSRDWSSDPGGYKGASLDLAAALAGKACGADEYHVWTIADFAAGVTLSEGVDEAFRGAGWTLDLISRDSELSRIYLARNGEEALILDWMPEEGVVGLLICVAAEPGSVPERVAEAAPSRGFSLIPGGAPPGGAAPALISPVPRPAPRGEAAITAADAGAPAVGDGVPAAGVAEAATPGIESPIAVAALEAGAGAGAILPAAAAPATATAGAGGNSSVPPTAAPAVPPVDVAVLASPAAGASTDTSATLPVASAPTATPLVATTLPAAAPGTTGTTQVAVPAPASPFIAAPSPTRVPIDLGMTAAITEPAPAPAGELTVAAAETTPPAGAPPAEPLSAMYERFPPPPGLVSPRSVAVTPIVRPATGSSQGPGPPAPAAPTAVAQNAPPSGAVGAVPSDPARDPVGAERVPVTTVIAPALEPRGASWPLFLLAVLLAGAALAILFRRQQGSRESDPHALWPTALASVVGADLHERVGNEGILFTPVLRYRFAIGENEYEATTEGWGGRALPSRSAAESVIANFPDHARVEISYDPTDPTRIVLPEAEAPADPLVMVAVACLGLAALTLLLTLF